MCQKDKNFSTPVRRNRPSRHKGVQEANCCPPGFIKCAAGNPVFFEESVKLTRAFSRLPAVTHSSGLPHPFIPKFLLSFSGT